MLVLNQFALPRSEGGGTRHVELFERLDGWEPTILAASRSMHDQHLIEPEGRLQTVPVTKFRGNGLSRVVNWASYSLNALTRGLFRRRQHVVYGSSPHLGAAVAGFLIAKAHRARFVLEVRDLWPQILVDTGMFRETDLVYRLLKQLERFLYRQADTIVVLAKGSIDAIAAEGIDPGKIRFVPNGADPCDFEVDRDRDELREEYGLSNTTVVYAGAHGPANGLDLVLDAAEKLQGLDVTFLLVGDGVAKAELQADAERRGLDNVEFRGLISKERIPELFAAADIGLHCLADVPLFHHGVSPNKLYDYMAAGLPVITNTPGEVAAMVEDAGAGEAVVPDGIVDAVRYLHGLSRSARLKLGESGQEWMARIDHGGPLPSSSRRFWRSDERLHRTTRSGTSRLQGGGNARLAVGAHSALSRR